MGRNLNFKLSWGDRQSLKELLQQGYSILDLQRQTEISRYQLEKEIRSGLKEKEDFKLRLYGKYDPFTAVYTQIVGAIGKETMASFMEELKKKIKDKEI